MLTYRGFNTIDQTKKFRLTNLDLVKRDLLNHFSIRKGEKLMNPNFGSIIWNVLFDPLDEQTKKVIYDDIQNVASYDPRLAIDQVIVQQLDHGLQIQVSLTYTPSNTSTIMNLEFNGETGMVSSL
jgi:phage baseplate assembly protein W